MSSLIAYATEIISAGEYRAELEVAVVRGSERSITIDQRSERSSVGLRLTPAIARRLHAALGDALAVVAAEAVASAEARVDEFDAAQREAEQ